MAIVRILACVAICAGLILVSGCESVQHQRVVPVASDTLKPAAPVNKPGTVNSSSALTPPIVFALIKRASTAMRSDDLTASLRALEQALRIAPKEAQVYLAYGDYYLLQNQDEQARQMLYRAMSLAGENSQIGKLAQMRLDKLSK